MCRYYEFGMNFFRWLTTKNTCVSRQEEPALQEGFPPQATANPKGERRKNLDKEINYFIKANEAERLNYHKIASLKLPIGSGAVESLIRQAVNLRMKGNSKFWLKENAEIMLHARCQWIAGSWNSFCNSILTALLCSAASC